MKASHWISGCVIAALVAAPAAAMADDLTTQDLGSVQHTQTTSNTGGSPDGGTDTTSIAHSNDGGSGSTDNSSDGGSNVPTSTSSRQALPHRSSVGWQSLLPGSIQ